MVDIFEAGPVIECPRDQIRTLRESRVGRVVSIREPTAADPDSIEYLVTGRRRFGVGKGPVSVSEGGREVTLTRELAVAVGVESGDEVRFAPLRSRAGSLARDASNAHDRPRGAR
jgi:arginine N-succinyltransferase